MLTSKSKNLKTDAEVTELTRLAIAAAVAADWKEAEKLNKKIVSISEDDVEALNRLARAQVCEGDTKKAEKTYKKVLTLDPYNIIAKKNLEKLTKLPKTNGNGHANGDSHTHGNGNGNFSNFFLYEPGKTKMIQLLNLAPPAVVSALNCGQKLALTLKKHSICISTESGTYLGALPDDLSHKLLTFINGGNKYEVYVKFATPKKLAVFIREIERSAKFENQPSFQTAA